MEDSEENIHVDTGAERTHKLTNLHATWVNFFLQSKVFERFLRHCNLPINP